MNDRYSKNRADDDCRPLAFQSDETWSPSDQARGPMHVVIDQVSQLAFQFAPTDLVSVRLQLDSPCCCFCTSGRSLVCCWQRA
jgi:hypothetical protein